MGIHRAYKVELGPNNLQRTLLHRHAGAARWAYNWGLARKIYVYKETKRSPNNIALHRELNKFKKVPKENGGVPWMYESSKCAPQECEECGLEIDRDLNAALNLKNLAESSSVSACGEDVSLGGFTHQAAP